MSVPTQTHFIVCESLQKEEWQVLEAIHPDLVSSPLADKSLKLEIPVELDSPRSITAVDDAITIGGPASPSSTTVLVSTLPPLLLHAVLPSDYPIHSPPEISLLHATSSWISQLYLEVIRQNLLQMWQTGEGVLYNWVEYLRTAEFLNAFRLESATEADETIRIPNPAPHLLIPLLEQYDKFVGDTAFSKNVYDCGICLTEYKGARCMRLMCTHVFCHSCLKDFWGLHIAEGSVEKVGCPHTLCIKAGREAAEDDVLRVVSEEEVKRWRWLREKRNLEKDPTIVHCPLSFCQTAIRKSASESEGYEKLRTCGRCGYSFCIICKHAWHGPFVDCMKGSIIEEYLALPEESPERVSLEQRYGKAKLMAQIAKYQAEQSNLEWIERSTMACPKCQVHVQKSQGCNHMTCTKCDEHFCYRCGEKLDPSDPYQHFSNPGRCHQKLFDWELVDEPVDEF